MKYPFEHRIIKPFKYTSAAATDVGVTIRRARAAIEHARAKAATVNNVRPMREKKAA